MSFDPLLGETSLGRRLARVVEHVEAQEQTPLHVVVLDLTDLPEYACPEWALPLDRHRGAVVLSEDAEEREHVAAALIAGRTPEGIVLHECKPGLSRFVILAVGSMALKTAPDEVAVWGARGDRKTTGVLLAIMLLAWLHRQGGYPGPLRVMAATASFTAHELKLCRSLLAYHWHGCWSLRRDNHEAVLRLNGHELAILDLFGTSDQAAYDRLRGEAHVLWVEEAAAAALDGDGGVPIDAYSVGLTSLRLETRRHVALVSSNYGDEDAWCWVRFEGTPPQPGTASVRIRPGESASDEDRQRWATQLANRPDLLSRLLDGMPGSVIQGPQVAKGFATAAHVARTPLTLFRGADLWLGWDSAPNAHSHATIIAQRNGPSVNVFAGLVSQESGLKQHLESVVLPWISRRVPWVLDRGGAERLLHAHDPVMNTEEGDDFDANPVLRIRRSLGGSFRPGPVDWPSRIGPLLALLNTGNGRGGMALQIDPTDDTELLRKALISRWFYPVTRGGVVVRDLPAKPNHPWEDLGDALAYLVCAIAPSKPERPRQQQHQRSYSTSGDPWGRHAREHRERQR